MASKTFGLIRERLAQAIDEVYFGKITPEQGEAIAKLAMALNANVAVEIKAAGLSHALKGELHSFGRVIGMGRRKIGDDDGEGGEGGVPTAA